MNRALKVIVVSSVLWFPAAVWGQGAKGPPPATVAVQPVKVAEIRETVSLVGTAEAHKQAVVASQVEGWAEEILFEEGDRVEREAVLARLEASSLQIRLEGAKAALGEAAQRREQAIADLKRLKALIPSKLVAEKEYQDAQFEVRARREKVRALQAEVEQIEDLLAKKTIRAPFSGWIAEQHVEHGEWLDQGGAVATLVDLSRIDVVVPVPERFLPLLTTGREAEVTLDALPEKHFPGRILAILPRGDTQSRTFSVKVEIENDQGVVRSGMLCRVTLSVGPPREALMVHKDALVLEGLQKAVFTVNDRVAHRTDVRVLGYQQEYAAVEGSLGTEDVVVIRGNERLRDGQPVVIVDDRARETGS